MRKSSIKLMAAVAALGLVFAACAESDSGGGDSGADTAAPAGTDAPAGTEAPADSTAPAGTDAPSDTEATSDTTAGTDVDAPEGDFTQDEIDQWGIDYTGATPGEASGEPLKIGYVNQEAVFPENTVGINAAIEYINTELGGFGGRPGELVKCEVMADEDGTKCGTEMLNNPDISFVLTGTLLNGNQQLYDVLQGKKPVIIGNAVTNPDFLTTAGVGYPTGSVGVIPGMAEFAVSRLDPKPTNAAIVYASNPAGQAGVRLLAEAGVRRRGHPGDRRRSDGPGCDCGRRASGDDRRRRRQRPTCSSRSSRCRAASPPMTRSSSSASTPWSSRPGCASAPA